MLSPNDISQKKFDKVLMGGYDMGAVDDFLDILEKDYGTLYNENIVLKNKMKLLVKKIEEYRSMDESMRKALNNAQIMAAQIVEKANAEALEIKNKAHQSSDEILSEYEEKIALQERKLSEAKKNVSDFVERMTTMYSQGAEMLQTVVGYSKEIKPEPAKTEKQLFEPNPKSTDSNAEGSLNFDNSETEKLISEIRSNSGLNNPAGFQAKSAEKKPSESAIADTAQLPNIAPANNSRFSSNYTNGSIYPNSVVRRTNKQSEYDDEGETILLTPKPKFEFDDLQFGENYNNATKNK